MILTIVRTTRKRLSSILVDEKSKGDIKVNESKKENESSSESQTVQENGAENAPRESESERLSRWCQLA